MTTAAVELLTAAKSFVVYDSLDKISVVYINANAKENFLKDISNALMETRSEIPPDYTERVAKLREKWSERSKKGNA